MCTLLPLTVVAIAGGASGTIAVKIVTATEAAP
jgi:hypothetical protein